MPPGQPTGRLRVIPGRLNAVLIFILIRLNPGLISAESLYSQGMSMHAFILGVSLSDGWVGVGLWLIACRAGKGGGGDVFDFVALFSGCAGLPLATPTVCSAGSTADLAAAVADLRARFPCAPLCAVAFSAGALLLTKYLGQAGGGPQRSFGSGY